MPWHGLDNILNPPSKCASESVRVWMSFDVMSVRPCKKTTLKWSDMFVPYVVKQNPPPVVSEASENVSPKQRKRSEGVFPISCPGKEASCCHCTCLCFHLVTGIRESVRRGWWVVQWVCGRGGRGRPWHPAAPCQPARGPLPSAFESTLGCLPKARCLCLQFVSS